MFDQAKHKVILIEILKAIYADPELRTILGFKGGTAAMLFYDLPRLSVDLDFDLLEADKKELVFKKVKTILGQFGAVREAREKRFSLFFLLSYGVGERTVKVDISKRRDLSSFQLKTYLGIPVAVMKPEDMLAGKLSALLTRKKLATRDVFDLWFFLQKKWTINESVLKEKTGLNLGPALKQAVKIIKGIKTNRLLQDLGELLGEKQKVWIKNKLAEETIFYLSLYRKVSFKSK